MVQSSNIGMPGRDERKQDRLKIFQNWQTSTHRFKRLSGFQPEQNEIHVQTTHNETAENQHIEKNFKRARGEKIIFKGATDNGLLTASQKRMVQYSFNVLKENQC